MAQGGRAMLRCERPGEPGRHRRRRRRLGGLLVLALAAGACGSNGDDDGASEDVNQSTAESSGDPVPGGTLVYGLEADTANGWAPYRASYATAGYVVLSSISDSLFAVNDDGEIVPLLAESVEHSEDYTQW